jgi:penicillin G amidase
MRFFHPVLVALTALITAGPLVAVPSAAQPAEEAVVQLPGLQAEARLVRDVRGIPHLFAANEHDLYFLQGWVHAEDRLFQMDLTRRQASGTLAELLGPAALSSDVELRTIGLRRAAERSLAALSDTVRAHLTAYAAGVNAWVAANPLPIEYGLLERTTFDPWVPVDSVVVAKAIAFSLSFDLDVEATVAFATAVATGAALGFDGAALYSQDLNRSAPFYAASTVPDATGGAVSAASSTRPSAWLPTQATAASVQKLPAAALALGEEYLARARRVPMLQPALSPLARDTGSNQWAFSARHTAERLPLMANDPHLALDVPATFHPIHLRAPSAGIDVIGSGFAGVPYVVLGQNRHITWGATTNPMDVTDTYAETVVPDASSPSGLSTVYHGTLEPVIPIPQLFHYNQLDGVPDNLATGAPGDVVGGAFLPPAVLIVPRRNQGPIVALDLESGSALSVQYTGFSGTRELETFRLWNRARSLVGFVEGLQYFDAGSQNWSVADIYGQIAYFSSAEMPLREDLEAGTVAGLPPWFIRDGTGGNEWLPFAGERPPHHAIPYQILPFEEMPQIVNPPSGWFVNANNDPAGTTLDNDPLNQLRPSGGLYYLNPGYSDGLRAGRITDRVRQLAARGGVTMADMEELQADVVLPDAQFFVPRIVAAWQAAGDGFAPGTEAHARLADAIARLAAWDFTAPTGIPEGWDAADVDGVRLPPSDDEIAASVAATIFSVWRGQMIRSTIDATLGPLGIPAPGSARAVIALRHLLERDGVGVSGLDFFAGAPGATPAERADHTVVAALASSLELLSGPDFATAFGGSTDADDYRWGLLHRIVFDHPLGSPFSIPPAGGAVPPELPAGLPGIAVDGGYGAVDASGHSARADSDGEFRFGSGPVRRYVGRPGVGPGSIDAVTALPGGVSGDVTSPFYANLLPLWLTNDAYPVVQRFPDLLRVVATVEIFRP